MKIILASYNLRIFFVSSFLGFCYLFIGNVTDSASQELTVSDYHESAIGVTHLGSKIGCFVSDADFDVNTKKVRVLLIGGLDGEQDSVEAVLSAIRRFTSDEKAEDLRNQFVISAVPSANPDGLSRGLGEKNASGGIPGRGYPPQGKAYGSPNNPEAEYLWRWIGMHAPDIVVEVVKGRQQSWFVADGFGKAWKKLSEKLHPRHQVEPADRLVRQLGKTAPCETGIIPALQVRVTSKDDLQFLVELLTALKGANYKKPSSARKTLIKRSNRSAIEIAKQLSRHYGHDLLRVEYIPALALIGRLRLGKLTGDETHLKEVQQITAAYFTGTKSSAARNGSGLSGHLVFCELAAMTKGKTKERFIDLAKAAADLGFDSEGKPKDLMPFHSEMSDALFMGGPILARVGRLTGEQKYFDACVGHLRNMRKIVLREDGLYRHSPLDEAAWGRGNGFPALGLAMCLSDFPKDHPAVDELLAMFRAHISALAHHQDAGGFWHQMIDKPESYRELSCTCMITFAMIRGVRSGLLKKEVYQGRIQKAWNAIRLRIDPSGSLVDVCTGTGKQKNLRAYYDRPAILGRDPRGGAMALMVSTEMAQWQKELQAE